MNKYLSLRSLLPVLGLAVCAAACDPGGSDQGPVEPTVMSESSDRPQLSLQALDEQTFAVSFMRGPGTSPRMMELFLELSSGLSFEEATPGAATAKAGKQLVAQELEGGVVRLVLYSTGDLATFESGELARIKFDRDGQAKGTVSIRTDRPPFAPQEATEGLLVADPLDL